jgi:hypothetical protein
LKLFQSKGAQMNSEIGFVIIRPRRIAIPHPAFPALHRSFLFQERADDAHALFSTLAAAHCCRTESKH